MKMISKKIGLALLVTSVVSTSAMANPKISVVNKTRNSFRTVMIILRGKTMSKTSHSITSTLIAGPILPKNSKLLNEEGDVSRLVNKGHLKSCAIKVTDDNNDHYHVNSNQNTSLCGHIKSLYIPKNISIINDPQNNNQLILGNSSQQKLITLKKD